MNATAAQPDSATVRAEFAIHLVQNFGGGVFPCTGKAPLVREGFKSAISDPDQIRAIARANPQANWGWAIPTGLCVVDFDPRNHSTAPRRCKGCGAQVALADSCTACGAPKTNLEAIYGLPAETRDPILARQLATFPDLTPTATIRTGDGGEHRIYRIPEDKTLPGKVGDGIDSRVGGSSYVMCPGSVHPVTGHAYEWMTVAVVPDAPESLAAKFRPRVTVESVEQDWIDEDVTRPIEEIDALAAQLEPHYVQGQRHHLAKALGGWLKQRGWTYGDVASVIHRLNPCTQNVLDAAKWAFTTGASFGWSELQEILGPEVADQLDTATPNPQKAADEAFVEALRPVLEKYRSNQPANDQSASTQIIPAGALVPFVRAGISPDWVNTEQGDAELFAAQHRHMVRWVPAWQKWAGFDGRRWTFEAGEIVARQAWQATLRSFLGTAAQETDVAQARALTGYAHKRMSRKAEEAVLSLAKSRLAIEHKVFDRDPWILNVENGILDLRTGQLAPHAAGKFCTKLASVTWDPAAQCPKWREFLSWAMCEDFELVSYLQRFFGLCLTGDASHETLTIFFGGGANGKTTAVSVFEALLGEYSVRAPARMLMASRNEQHPTELADFAGRRLVTLAETKQDQVLDDQVLKLIASRDEVAARRMREDFWRFAPTHKPLLMTNHMPRVRGQDNGVWRRIALVPWRATIGEAQKDRDLPEKLKAELPGILNWALSGLSAVQRNGLAPPKAVTEASESYRQEEDAVERWLDGECETGPGFSVQARPFAERYNDWAKSMGESVLSERAFASRLERLGFSKEKRRDGAHWLGVRIRVFVSSPSAISSAYGAV